MSNVLRCRWAGCPLQDQLFNTPVELSLHVEDCHVTPCSGQDLFICYWEGCKVYNKPSYSFGWLQRHVRQLHTKERPNKCLMNGCNMSFNSVDALQKHMLRHFDTNLSTSVATKSSRSSAASVKMPRSVTEVEVYPKVEESATSEAVLGVSTAPVSNKATDPLVAELPSLPPPPVPARRQSLKVKIPRKTLCLAAPYTITPIAFNGAHFHSEMMDRKTMSVIRHTTRCLAHSDLSNPASSITLTSQIIGQRQIAGQEQEDGSPRAEVLVRWSPRIIPDEWVCLEDYCDERVLPFNKLPPTQLSNLASKCFGFSKLHKRKSKRKP